MTRLLDLSHTVEHGLETYPGLPAPRVGSFLSHAESEPRYAPGTTFHIGTIEMVSNTGTYLDSPFHRFADGADLSQLPLESLADLPGIRISAPANGRCIRPADLRGCAVLFETGWSRHWGTQTYFGEHPYVSAEAADALVVRGAALVGIDSLNIDDTADGTRPVHTALLRAEIPVVEHLTHLGALGDAAFRFFAVPVKVRGMGTFPVRAFARVGE